MAELPWQPAGLSCYPNTPKASLQLFAEASYFPLRGQKNHCQSYISTEAITFNFFFNLLICQAYTSRNIFAESQKHLWNTGSPKISTTPGVKKKWMEDEQKDFFFFLSALKLHIQFCSKWCWEFHIQEVLWRIPPAEAQHCLLVL